MSCDILITALCLEVVLSNYFNSVKIEMYLPVPCLVSGEASCCT